MRLSRLIEAHTSTERRREKRREFAVLQNTFTHRFDLIVMADLMIGEISSHFFALCPNWFVQFAVRVFSGGRAFRMVAPI